jgi:hypothetical protein
MAGHGGSIAERGELLGRKAFLRTWGSPDIANQARELDNREYRYRHLWGLYTGTAFDSMRESQHYRSAFGLYRGIRQVWDHCHEIVEFYATHIWSGAIARDGKHLPDGILNAVPIAEDTDDKLAAAIAQCFMWWNFQELMAVIVRYTAALGELLVEIRDDPKRGKVMIELIWPGFVTDIRLDDVGNIKWYRIEYSYFDRDDNTHHTYRRDVDGESFRTYRDDKPYNFVRSPIPEGTDPDGTIAGLSFGSGATVLDDDDDGYRVPNPYGFVPAVWFRHNRVIGVRGEPAIWSTEPQLDEINSLFSHMLDKTHVSLEAPIIISGNINPNRLAAAFQNMVGSVKRTFTSDMEDERAPQEELNVLEGPQGTSISTIEIKITEAAEALDRIIAAIERKCPEVTFYSALRNMAQVTGPGASRLLGDVDRKVKLSAAGYDNRLIALLQMAIAICGDRLKEGADGWSDPSDAQKKFEGFDLESFKKGDLDFDIMPRDLVPATVKDRYEVLQMKKLVLPFLPDDQLAYEGGYDREQAKTWSEDYKKEQEEKAEQAMLNQQKAPFGAPAGGKVVDIKKPVGAPPGGPQRGQPDQNRSRQRN